VDLVGALKRNEGHFSCKNVLNDFFDNLFQIYMAAPHDFVLQVFVMGEGTNFRMVRHIVVRHNVGAFGALLQNPLILVSLRKLGENRELEFFAYNPCLSLLVYLPVSR